MSSTDTGLRHITIKTAVNAVIVILFSVYLIVSLNLIQSAAARQQQREDSLRTLNEIAETYEENREDAAELEEIFHAGNRETLADLQKLLSSGLLDDYVSATDAERAERFGEIMERTDVQYLFVMRASGDVVLSADADAVNTNLQKSRLLTSEQIAALVAGETVDCDNEFDSIYFYAAQLQSRYGTFYLVMGEDSAILDEQYRSLTNIGDLIGNTSVSGTGFVFAVDPEEQTFLYYDDGKQELSGQNISECGLGSDALQDDYAGLQTISGTKYYCVSCRCGDFVIITAAVATDDLYGDNTKVVFWSATLFLMTAFVSLSYAVFVHTDMIRQQAEPVLIPLHRLKNGTTIAANRSITKKILPVMGIGLLLIFCAGFYVQTLLSLSDAVSTSSNTITEIEKKVDRAETLREEIQEYYESRYLARIKLISYALELDPSALNADDRMTYSEYDSDGLRHTIADDEGNPLQSAIYSKALQDMCSENDMHSVFVFDSQGRTIATSTDVWYFILSREKDTQSNEFLQVLDGRVDSFVQTSQIDDQGNLNQYVGTTFHYYTTVDEDGNTLYVSLSNYESQEEGTWTGNHITKHSSLVQCAVSSSVMARILNSTEVTYIINSTSVYQDGFIMVFDASEEHTLLCSPFTGGVIQDAQDLGLGENCFSGNYNGFRTIDGEKYFLCCRLYGNYYLCTAVPVSELYTLRLRISLITVLISFICLFLMTVIAVVTTDREEQLFRQMSKETDSIYRDNRVTVTTGMGDAKTTHSIQSALIRLDGRWRKWFNRTPEQKLLYALSLCGGLLTLYLVLTMFGIGSFFGSDSILTYIVSENWEHSFNIFALTACGMLLITVLVGVALLRTFILSVTGILGIKSETMGKLMISILKYGSTLFCLFYGLYMIGLDGSSLIASAGILSVIIGLGAQSLIGDILAGIFIVFEGEFRVGDIVTVDGFRGRVLEIGLRTTKIVDTTDNIKIFNNSKITGVLNMTKRTSRARCELSVSYGQSLEKIEVILTEELPKLRESIPLLLKDPEYKGVSKLGDSCVSLLILGECLEGDRPKVERALNRELLLICKRYGIDIPFPQVTVSALKESPDEASARVRSTAGEYAAQRLASTSPECEEDEEDESGKNEENR